MAQRPKPEVRDAIVQAAAEAFADVGFERAALSDIVQRAGTSIGNFYKYFDSKGELFAAFLPRGFSAEVERRIRAQVEALRGEQDVFSLADDHPYRRASEELVRFTIAHRHRIVFLLLRAGGTRHAQFRARLVRLLVGLALEHARATYAGFAATSANKRALTRIYTAYITTLGGILEQERSQRAIREALTLQTTYHLSGLKAFFLGAHDEELTMRDSP